MSKPSPFSIELPKLREGLHQFEFELRPDAFADLATVGTNPEAHPLAVSATGTVKLDLHRSNRLIDCQFEVTGTLHLACDRCLLPYDQPLHHTERLIYSFEPSLKESQHVQINDDVQYLDPETQVLDFQQDLYDFVALQAPFRRIPPEDSGHVCPPEILALIKNIDAEDDDLPELSVGIDQPADSTAPDSPFAALLKLKQPPPPSDN